ncbi:MAG: CBS domain-containing protein [Pirellulaceae bacterium]
MVQVAGVEIVPTKAISADVTLGKAIEFLLSENLPMLMVVDAAEKIIGVVSETRLLAAAFDTPLQTDPVSLHIERKFISISPDSDLEQIVETFLLHRVRHLPVIGADRRAIGILSRRDVLRHLADVSVTGSR